MPGIELSLDPSRIWARIPVVSLGAQIESKLQDGEGQTLAVVRIAWDRVRDVPNPEKKNYNPSMADFTIEMVNNSSCVFTSRTLLRRPGDPIGVVVTALNWFGWVNLNEPSPGESKRIQRSKEFGRPDLDRLEWIPEDKETVLSACRTTTPRK